MLTFWLKSDELRSWQKVNWTEIKSLNYLFLINTKSFLLIESPIDEEKVIKGLLYQITNTILNFNLNPN